MLGAILVFIYCVLACGAGHLLFRRLLSGIDPSAQIGISGLLTLGLAGTVLFFIGLISVSIGISVATLAVMIAGLAGWSANFKRGKIGIQLPKGASLAILAGTVLLLAMSLVGVLAPSTGNDWDSLAYHLAVPKMWMLAGKIEPISFIHQSNFPFAFDSLYFLGLKWGGESAAKMFTWCSAVLGSMAVFGFARARYGSSAGWIACLTFAAMPIVLWLSATAYIDVPHGLYAGLGIALICLWLESDDARYAWLGALCLGLAAATKYTGLQTIAVSGLVALVGVVVFKRSIKTVLLAGVLALAVAGPWYLKNAAWKENPVFPFFYGVLGGKDWDQRRAEIYTREQNTFGVGRPAPPNGSIEPTRLGHSIFGLAYQPGRFVNPAQTQGMGDPMGAIGVAIIGALFMGLVSGKKGRFESTLIISVLVSLAIWFILTQQSRYILALAPPLAILAGSLTTRKWSGWAMTALLAIQALMSLYTLNAYRFSDQIQVVTGRISPDEYRALRIPFYEAAKEINSLGPDVNVAMYDEVFGYLLDVPYFWANPGHGTMIPYDSMQSGQDYASEMKKLGFTHVLVRMIENNRAPLSSEPGSPTLGSAMLSTMAGQAFPEPYRRQLLDNWEVKFKVLISEAVGAGSMKIERAIGRPDRPPRFLLLKL